MRVMWFTNCLLPQAAALFRQPAGTSGGGWMAALLEALQRSQPDTSLCVATAGRVVQPEERVEGNVHYVLFPDHTSGRFASAPSALREAEAVVQAFQPDLIHVHGTERCYGLLAAQTPPCVPMVVSLQGLLGPYAQWPAFFGQHTPSEVVVRLHRWHDWLLWRGLGPEYLRFRADAAREVRILRAVQHVMGRTRWDRAYALGVNPRLAYHHVGELLRAPFWTRTWELSRCVRHSIIFTNAVHPRKGAEMLLDAFRLVLRNFPDATLRIAGQIAPRTGYGRYLLRRVRECGERVQLLGLIAAEPMAEELARAHVFVSPSFIDNSPNALCEAQLMGLPVVSTLTGGCGSLVEEGRSGLLVPPGDPFTLAARLEELFRSDALATRLSLHGRQRALARHAPDTVVGQLVAAYEAVVNAGDRRGAHDA